MKLEEVRLEGKHVPIEYGEGHNVHQLKERDAIDGVFSLPKIDNEPTAKQFLVLVKKETELQHVQLNDLETLTQEHDTIPIPNGLYVFGNQRQVDSDGIIRVVVD